MALEEIKTPKLNLKKSLISSSVFSGASITPKVSFGGLAKAIGSQPSFLDTPKLDVPKANPLADIVSQLQVKFESLSSTVRSNVRKITLLKRVLEAEKKPFGGKEDPIEETNRILVEIQNQLALDFASRIAEKKEKLDLIRDSILKKKQKEDEEDLEKVNKNTRETNKKLDKVIKPARGIFDKILEFFSLFGGAVIADAGFKWLSDPENQKKLTGIFDWLTGNWDWIAGGLAIGGVLAIAGSLALAVSGIWGTIGLIGTALSALAPLALPILAIAAAAWVGSKVWKAIASQFSGGEVIQSARVEAKLNFRQSAENLNLNTPLNELKMSGNGNLVYPATHPSKAGMAVFTKNRLGNKLWTGPADALVDPTGKSGGNSLMIWPWSQRADGSYWGTEAQRKLVYKYSDITREIGSPGQGIQGDMWNEIRAERERVKNERLPGQEGLSDVSLTNYKIETKRLMDLAEQEVKSKYKTKLNKLVKFNAGGTAIGKPGYDQINAKLTPVS